MVSAAIATLAVASFLQPATAAPPAPARPRPASDAPIVASAPAQRASLRSALVIPMPVQRSAARSLVRIDPVEYEIVTGTWKPPVEGQPLMIPAAGSGPKQATWTRVNADEQGVFQGPPDSAAGRALAGGYFDFTVQTPRPRVMLLDAAGHGSVFVNGVPRGGDPYATGSVVVPIQLVPGNNDLLFAVGRGQFRAALQEPPAPAFVLDRDLLLPSIVAGAETTGPVGAVIVNASLEPLTGMHARVVSDLPEFEALVPVGTMPPLTVKKIALPARFGKGGAAARSGAGKSFASRIELRDARDKSVHSIPVEFKVVGAGDRRVVTRRSTIDDSVQYYSLVPSTAARDGDAKPGILLSLHGASVEATSQANAYKPKKEAHIVCPTNRRPFGFDWEDWGRLDAAEALAHARKHLDVDPHKTWLTGHSMGGHGTWQLGAHFPGEFAAIAPSAGWISFASYTGMAAGETPAQQMLARAGAASDTLLLRDNYIGNGVYVLHGDADDNVPVDQAREMFRQMAAIGHPDFQYYERPGAGHWWGDECVDWPPLMRFLFAHQRAEPAGVRHVRFATVAPQVSQRRDWVRVQQQLRPFEVSRVDASFDPAAPRVSARTENVATLELVPPIPATADGQPRAIAIDLDGQQLQAVQKAANPHLRFVRGTDEAGAPGPWALDPASAVGDKPAPIPPTQKKPARGGPFKMAFAHGFVAVVGTQGDPAEAALVMAKARLDAETWWVRGNGRFEIVLDRDFDPARHPSRNVILYGNADQNLAWPKVLGAGDAGLVRHGALRGPTGEHAGDDLAVLCVRPRSDDPNGQVGIVASTGAVGTRALMRAPVFLAGVGIPDLVAWRAAMLRDGASAIVEAGFYGNDWSVERGSWMPTADQTAPTK